MSDAKTNVVNVVTSIKDCADVGMYTFSKMSPQLAAFVGVGLFVKNLIVSTADDANAPVLKELKELKVSMKKLDDSMRNHFNDLKAFIVATNFYNNIAVKAAVLCQFWTDITAAEDEKTRESSATFFREMYDKNSPVELSETLLQLLNNEMTNFLKSAMTADKLMTKESFNTHKNIIGGVFAQFWMLESIASGLFQNGRTYRADKIAENYREFEKISEKWEQEYTEGDNFWPDRVRQFVEEIQDKNEEKTSAEKADMIQAGLEKIMTNDLFYIVVCRSAFRCLLYNHPADQTIASWDRKACNVFIFRSKKARTASADEMKKFQEDLDKNKTILRHRTEQNNRNAEWMLQSQVEQRARDIPNCAFMVVVRSGEYVAVRSTHTEIRKNGPGGWIDGKYHPGNLLSFPEPFKMVAGFH